MSSQEIIQQILVKHPELTQEGILENLKKEKERVDGLLGDETLLRLIAAKFGVEVPQNIVHNDGNLSTNRLLAGLNDVTVAGRLIAVFPVKTFQGEKPGKFATLMIADNDGILRVVLWNEKSDFVERGELKAGMVVRLVHGYTRQDRYGKTELHLGGKSQIEVDFEGKTEEFPSFEKFAVKISELGKAQGTVHLAGVVREILGVTSFTRSDSSNGMVMRFTFADVSGQVTVVAWNEKAAELEKTLKPDSRLELVNGKVKENQNGTLEVHVDFNSFINIKNSNPQTTKIADLIVDFNGVNVEGEVSSVPEVKEVTTSKSEIVRLMVFDLKDESGCVRVSVWREHAENLRGLKIGDRVAIENAYAKKGYENKIELSTRSASNITVKTL